jgi:hypothetical protein
MATSVYLSNPVVTINSVDLTDQCTSAVVNYVYEQLETTAFGDTARKYGASTITSLQNNSIEVELYQSRMRQAKPKPRSLVWLASHAMSLLRQRQALHQPQTRFSH